MSQVRRFDHVGLTVADLDVVTGFFVALGLEVEGRTFVEGEFLDTVCGRSPGDRAALSTRSVRSCRRRTQPRRWPEIAHSHRHVVVSDGVVGPPDGVEIVRRIDGVGHGRRR
jgi:catechol 2,3-dioxygenase-like lactoylglutathione lyase family enzyme